MDFNGKKVAIIGYGLEAKAMLPFLAQRGALVSVCDARADLGSQDGLEGLELRLGEGYLEGLADFDVIVRSPGVPFLTPQIQAAKEAGAVVTSQTKIFFDECRAKTIGVTGTKGKGTTCSLIKEMFERAGQKVFLVGNIGVPMISVLGEAGESDWIVVELSSFQLQDLHKSPNIGVVLDIGNDHQDHHQSLQEYLQSKRNIVAHQGSSDFAVLNADSQTSMSFADGLPSQIYTFSKEKEVTKGVCVIGDKIVSRGLAGDVEICSVSDVKLPGKFNLINVAAASTAALLAGLAAESIAAGIASFKGLPHRLELVGEAGGVKYFNNSMATTPDAAIGSIMAFDQPVVLIVGGSSKGADFSGLVEAINKSSVTDVICIGQEGSKIMTLLQGSAYQGRVHAGASTMNEIVAQASQLAQSGGIVLLSPAAASFDMFKNAYDRGDQFRQAVAQL